MKARRPGQRICQICHKPLKVGEDTRRTKLYEGDTRIYAVHERCFVEDLPRIEAGLEPFKRFAQPSR